MEKNTPNQNGQLQIELKEEVAQGTYANLAIISTSCTPCSRAITSQGA